MAEKRRELAGMTDLAAGDPDVDVEEAYFSGEEAPGGETQRGRVQRRAAASGTRDELPGKGQHVTVRIRGAGGIQRHAGTNWYPYIPT